MLDNYGHIVVVQLRSRSDKIKQATLFLNIYFVLVIVIVDQNCLFGILRKAYRIFIRQKSLKAFFRLNFGKLLGCPATSPKIAGPIAGRTDLSGVRPASSSFVGAATSWLYIAVSS
jgi:hypothetical protein